MTWQWGYFALGAVFGSVLASVLLLRVYRKRLKQARAETEALQTQMQKLEQVRSMFVANVTHELKTPLTSIKGYIELLRDGACDPDTQEKFYDIIDIEAERLQVLIEDILQLSEIENSTDDPRQHNCDLHTLGKDLYDRFRPLAEHSGLILQVRVPQGLLVRGNSYRLAQLFDNLVDNAIKYNQEGGKVLLRAWHEFGSTIVRVSDTGVGIPKEHQEHIFERFYRVDKSRSRALGGTGLGLSIAKHVVQLHGGTIDVESRAGRGTIFTVRIPD